MKTIFFKHLKDFSKIFKKPIFLYSLFIIIIIFYSRNLFQGDLFRSHDLEFHGARLANYYLALKQGQIPPRWAPNLNFNFGYPVFLVSYFLPYALSVLWYIAGLSIEWSINLTILISIISAAVGFLSIGILKKNIKLGLLSSLIYISSTYIMSTIFIRGALGEIVFLGIIPWVFYLLESYFLSKLKTWFIPLFSLILIGLFLTHPPSVLVSIIIIFLYIWKNKTRFPQGIKPIILSIFIAIFSVQFFWTPFLIEKDFINAGQGISTSDYFQKFPQTLDLFWSKWSLGGLSQESTTKEFTKRIGIIPLLILLIVLFNRNYQKEIKVKFWISIFLLSIFMLTKYSKIFWDIFWPLQSLQFPWRLLWIPTLSSSMIIFEIFPLIKNKIYKKILIITIILVSIHHIIFYSAPAGYISNSDNQWLNYPFTTSSSIELDPIWFNSHKNLNYNQPVIVRHKDMSLIGEKGSINNTDASISIIKWDGTTMEYIINTPLNGDVVQRTAYFPGFIVKVDGENQAISFDDKEFPGRIVFPITTGKHNISAHYTSSTWDQNLGGALSIIGFLLLLVSFYIAVKKRTNKTNLP